MRIYIAGPMTGLPDLNFPAFHAAAAALRAAGYTVINPAELNSNPDASWYECMRIDIREMITCDSICLLPNWTMSRGARLEFHIAAQLNMQILDAATFIPAAVKVPAITGINDAPGQHGWVVGMHEYIHHGQAQTTREPV